MSLKPRIFSSELPEEIEIFKDRLKPVNVKYISNKQDSTNTMVLTISVNGFNLQDYRFRFMDSFGNPLEEQLEVDLHMFEITLNNYYGVHVTDFKEKFYDNLLSLLVGTALKRKTDLLDFHDPEIWKNNII